MNAPVHERAPTAGAALLVALAAAAWALLPGCRDEHATARPASAAGAEGRAPSASSPSSSARHVGSRRCQPCHPDEYAKWQRSHHQKSMSAAPGPLVLADFAGTGFEEGGVAARFTREDDALFASIAGERFRVAYALGYTPLQQYLIELPDGRLQVFPVAWDTAAARLFRFQNDDGTDPSMGWQGVFNNWNLMCATCHVTDLEKNYDPESDTYSTTWSEISVGCEACHGPGEAHVRWAQASPSEAGDRGLVAVQERAGFADEVALCGPCHARRQAITAEAPVGAPFYDHFVPELLREGLYFADGQIQDEVFVLGSFLQSEMFRRGVSCRHCHDPHSGGLVRPEEALCTGCHAAPLYDVPAHHLHDPGSEGSRCVACHMPERTYMGVDPRRDHSFRIPRPDLSARLGTPNACASCHSEETAQWAADAVARVHGEPGRRAGLDAGEVLDAGRRRDPDAVSALMTLAEDDGRPAIVRATALELLQAYPSAQTAEVFAGGLRSDEPLVRLASVDGTLSWPAQERASALAPLLRDPTRAVRIQAARALVDLESRMAPESPALSWFRRALEEYRAAQEANLDHPGARFNLGALHGARGDERSAAREYRAALSLAPGHVPAAVNLAAVLERRDEREAAASVLERALVHNPESGELHHALGLIRAGQERLDAAAEHLGQAVELLPPNPRLERVLREVIQQLE